MNKTLLLASRSPARRQLLVEAGYDVEFAQVDIDESVLPQEKPAELVQRLSIEKAKAVNNPGDRLLITADTMVVFAEQIIGKAKNCEQAKMILEQLAGNWHEVITGFTLCFYQATVCDSIKIEKTANNFPTMKTFVVTTKVLFHALSTAQIEEYLVSKEWQGKAGAYGIQGAGKKFVKKIVGSVSNVIGLPMDELAKAINEYKI